MLSKVIRSLPGRVQPVVELRWGNKTRLISLLLIIAILTSCSPGGNQTQAIPAPTTQPQLPDCKATDTGFCWPTGRDFREDNPGWLADSCSWSGHNAYQTTTLVDGQVVGLYHIGWDISAKEGDNVYAIADGTVLYVTASAPNTDSAGWGEGNVGVFVKHKTQDGKEFLALYAHVLYTSKVRENVYLNSDEWKLEAGKSFAKVGPYLKGSHLHFGIVPSGIRPDTDKANGIGWGKIRCPSTEPIANYNGFTNP